METNYTSDQLPRRRLAGELPRIKIAGHDFVIDWAHRQLIKANDAGCSISLAQLPLNPGGNRYYCYFDLKAMRQVYIKPDIMALPADVVRLEIPYELILDPVAVAREHNTPEAKVLKVFPIREHLEAKVIQLSETELPALVHANRLKQQEKRWLRPFRRKGKRQ